MGVDEPADVERRGCRPHGGRRRRGLTAAPVRPDDDERQLGGEREREDEGDDLRRARKQPWSASRPRAPALGLQKFAVISMMIRFAPQQLSSACFVFANRQS